MAFKDAEARDGLYSAMPISGWRLRTAFLTSFAIHQRTSNGNARMRAKYVFMTGAALPK